MPRTKLTKAATNKRARENVSELEDLLRDFDIDCENSLHSMRKQHQDSLDDVDALVDGFKRELGEQVLKLTIGDLKRLKSLNEVGQNKTINDLNATVKDKLKGADEGYLTEGATNKSRFTSDSENEKQDVSDKLGSLKTIKSRRRSKSACGMTANATPGPRAMMNHLKMRTPLGKMDPVGATSAIHASRSKFRTPLQKQTPLVQQRAISADRGTTIVPKVNPATPISILRHARIGEVAFSVTGSPIAPVSLVESTANVNIPVANGILSIRPENLDPAQLDTSLLNKFDTGTINHLRTLKQNLDVLMSKFEKRAHH